MHWLIGIDEAGYGPNLGPLVQAAVAARVPDGCDCLWSLLADAVCRAGDAAGGRVVIDDSKLVHGGPGGLAALELGVLTVTGDSAAGPWPLADLLDRAS